MNGTSGFQRSSDFRKEYHRPRQDDSRIKALENMKNHEALYMEFLESLSGKMESKAEMFRREELRIAELIEKNSKIVLKLVGSYFAELKDQWTGNYQQSAQEKVANNVGHHIKKIRQKLSKYRTISESFVSGHFEEDLLSYALDKDIEFSAAQIQKIAQEIDQTERSTQSKVNKIYRR